MYGYRFLSRDFTDRHEILHGGSATSQTGLLLFWWIAPGMAIFGRQQGPHGGGRIAGYAMIAEALVLLFLSSYLLCRLESGE